MVFIQGLVLQQITDFATRRGYIRTDVIFLFIFKFIYFNQIILVIYYDTNASSHSVSHFRSVYCDYLFHCRARVHCLCQFLFNDNNHSKNLTLNKKTKPTYLRLFACRFHSCKQRRDLLLSSSSGDQEETVPLIFSEIVVIRDHTVELISLFSPFIQTTTSTTCLPLLGQHMFCLFVIVSAFLSLKMFQY